MPTMFRSHRKLAPTCKRAFKWSTYRGGCRFSPGHAGVCKPKGR